MKFGTEFPQFAKVDVNGENAHPLFAELASEKPFEGFGGGVKNMALETFAKQNRSPLAPVAPGGIIMRRIR